MKKHSANKPIPPHRTAIAPYNFVPLPDRVITLDPDNDKDKIDHSRYANNRNTGQIVCKLTTETDLYIRSGLTASEFAASQQNAQPVDPPQRASLEELIAALQTNPKNKPQFFSTANSNQPVIPASSLRGMIRSLVEIASFSKVGWVSDRKLIFRTIGDTSKIGTDYRERLLEDTPLKEKRYTPKTEAGYIELDENNNWCIRPARKVKGCSFTRAFKFNTPKIPNGLEPTEFKHVRKIWYQLGDLVYRKYTKVKIKYFNVQDLSPNDKSGFEQGYIVYSGNMGNKKSEALVFPLDKTAVPISIPHDLVQIYRDQLSKEAIALLGDQGVLQDGCPVFYLIENGKLTFFGHNQMLRLAHRSSPKESIPDEINNNLNIPDLAEAIFGFVRQNAGKKEQALAGRVFFGNAHLAPEQGDVLKETQIPQILASPKPTTFQHYLVQLTHEQEDLEHYSIEGATIRGRKLYWHQQSSSAYMEDNDQARAKIRNAPKQYTCITPVNPGATFEFTIRFENLSNVELGALLWVLELANPDNEYRFKLGMGKPLGLGSVAINYELQLTDRKQRYQRLFDDDGNWETGFEASSQATQTKAIKAFCKFIDDSLDMDIEETEQIQQLRALLGWRDGAGVSFEGASALRYMEIERDQDKPHLLGKANNKNQVNEYIGRRVLPLPTQVSPPPPRELPRPPIADDPIKVKVIEIIGTKVIVQSPVYPNIRIEVDNDDGKSMKLGFTTKVIITEYADNNLVKAKWAK